MRRRILCAFALGALAFLGRAAIAAAPHVEEVSGQKTFADGEWTSLSLADDGVLRPGPAFEAVDLDTPTSWTAIQVGDDTWVGTGNGGELLRVDAAGKVERVATGGDALMVTALAPLPEGRVAAALAPGARLVTAEAGGTAKPLASIPAEYVWALLPDARGGLVAASGVPGALWHVDAFGAVEKILDVGDDHARCLARRGDEILVGTSPKGLVLSVRGHESSVVRDLDAQEVVGLVTEPDGSLLIAANQDQAGGNPQTLSNLLNQMMNIPPAQNGQKKAPPRPSLQSGVVLHVEKSGAVETLWEEKRVAALSMAADGDGAVVGTYPEGRLVRVTTGRAPAILADFPEAEVSVILSGAESKFLAVVTSNPAVLHRAKAGAPSGTFTTKRLDAGAVAHWGRVSVVGSGIKSVEARAGETDDPGDAWSAWKPIRGFDGASGAADLEGRFLQLRATLDGGDAELRGLRVVVASPNRAPKINELEVKRAGKSNDSGIPDPTPARTVTWKVDDPDEDRLLVRLEANRVGSPHWMRLVKDEVLDKPTYAWDTSGLPDGMYVVRLTVSDRPDNPPSSARETTLVSTPHRIDNTPPRVTVRARPSKGHLLLEGEVEDQQGGRVAEIRVSIDGGPWQVLASTDGLLDEATETYQAELDLPPAGPHDVVVQSRDADGNTGAAATVVAVR